MPVIVTMREENKTKTYDKATAAEIVQSGHLRIYRQSESGPDTVVGGVGAGLWATYDVVEEVAPPEIPEEVETPAEEPSA